MAGRKSFLVSVSLVLIGSKPVLGVTELVSSVVGGVFQLFFGLLQQVLFLFFYLFDTLVLIMGAFLEMVTFQIFPGIIEAASFVTGFFWNISTLILKSISNAAAYAYGTVVQLNWQLIFQTLYGYLTTVFKAIGSWTSFVIGLIMYAMLYLFLLLIFVGSYVLKAVGFIVICSWHMTVRMVELLGGATVHVAEFISSVSSMTISSGALKNVVTTIFFATGVVVLVMLLIKYKPYQKLYRWAKWKLQASAFRQPRPVVMGREILDHNGDHVVPGNDRRSPDIGVDRNERSPSRTSPFRHRYPTAIERRSLDQDHSDIVARLLESHENDIVCAVCFENPRKLVIEPCGHYCLCQQCVNEVRKCPICDSNILELRMRRRTLSPSSSDRGITQRHSSSRYTRQRHSSPPDRDIRQRHGSSPDQSRKRHPSSSDQSSLEKEKLEKELNAVKRLLEQQEEAKLCAVCFDKPRTIIVKPCKHYCLCENCRSKLKRCPICNTYILSAEKIFNV